MPDLMEYPTQEDSGSPGAAEDDDRTECDMEAPLLSLLLNTKQNIRGERKF
jgi:hypothetical protein